VNPLAGSLLLALLVAARQEPAEAERASWLALRERCGTELAWAPDWEAAAARARAEHKPVLAVAWLYPGFDLVDGSRSVFAMDEDVIELVDARCVPMRLTKETSAPFAAQASYGLSATAFGCGLLLVSPEGEVLADSPFLQPAVAYDFLCRELAALPQLAGEALPAGLSTEQRAERLLARGELEAAAKLLKEPRTARGCLLRARLLRRGFDVAGARAALAEAEAHEPKELGPALAREELQLELFEGRAREARAVCERLVREAPGREEALAASFTLGLLDLAAKDPASAARRWRALIAEHADSRWAVEAASALLTPAAQLAAFTLQPARPALLSAVRDVPWAPSTPTRDAVAAGLAWLQGQRGADGRWLDPSELEGGGGGSNAISVAIDALGARALLAQAKVDLAREAQLALEAARASLAQRNRGPAYMTYEVWSDALTLELFADLLAAGAGRATELRALGEELIEALARRQRKNGGWSYFDAVTLDADAPKLEQSISFVTATVVLALERAADAGIDFDEDVLEHGLDALEAMRDDAGVFAYFLWSVQAHSSPEAPAGAAGRAPLCELALFGAGRSDAARLKAALEQFVTYAATLDKERGKALMHCGPEGQGCHYVLYDYATAARALAPLPAAEQKPYRERLRELVLATRRADGAFLDTPILGAASGTALALAAFAVLDAPR